MRLFKWIRSFFPYEITIEDREIFISYMYKKIIENGMHDKIYLGNYMIEQSCDLSQIDNFRISDTPSWCFKNCSSLRKCHAGIIRKFKIINNRLFVWYRR